MHRLRETEGIMRSCAARRYTGIPPENLHDGLVDELENPFVEP
jgi:hypothetical protein